MTQLLDQRLNQPTLDEDDERGYSRVTAERSSLAEFNGTREALRTHFHRGLLSYQGCLCADPYTVHIV